MTPQHTGRPPAAPDDGAAGRARHLLLDFDGPMCRLFAEHPARAIAGLLHAHLDARDPGWHERREGGRSLDPHRVLRGTTDPALARGLEEILAREEEVAALSARPTTGADTFVRAMADEGRVLAVTTNNAPAAVAAYLKHHGLYGCFAGRVFGRDTADPALMKPHPHCLLRALDALGARAADCLMIGDSAPDALAARAAGVAFLGCARSAESAAALRRAAPYEVRVVVGMPAVLAAVRAVGPGRPADG